MPITSGLAYMLSNDNAYSCLLTNYQDTFLCVIINQCDVPAVLPILYATASS